MELSLANIYTFILVMSVRTHVPQGHIRSLCGDPFSIFSIFNLGPVLSFQYYNQTIKNVIGVVSSCQEVDLGRRSWNSSPCTQHLAVSSVIGQG